MEIEDRILFKVVGSNAEHIIAKIATSDIASFRLIMERANEPYIFAGNEIILYIPRSDKGKGQLSIELYEVIKQLHNDGYRTHEVYPYALYLAGKTLLDYDALDYDANEVTWLAYCEYVTKEYVLNPEYDPATRLILAHIVTLALLKRSRVVSEFKDYNEYESVLTRRVFDTLADALGIDKETVIGSHRYFAGDFRPEFARHGKLEWYTEKLDDLGLAEKIFVANMTLEEDLQTSLQLVQSLMVDERARKLAGPLWLLRGKEKCAKMLLLDSLENALR